MADGVVTDAHHADELGLDSGLLHDFPDRRLLDALALLDPAARDDRAELRVAGKVEHEQLVESGLRLLSSDIRGDGRPRSQLFSARILALYARFFSW